MPKRSRYEDRYEDSRSQGDKRYRSDGSDRWHRQDYRPSQQHERSYSTPGNFNQRAWSGQRPTFPPPTPPAQFDYRRPNWAPRPWQGGYGPRQPGNYVNVHDPNAQHNWDWRPGTSQQTVSGLGSQQKPGTSKQAGRAPAHVTDDGEDVIEINDDVITISDDVDEEESPEEKVTTPAAVQGYSQHGRGHQSYYAQAGEEAGEEEEGVAEEKKEDRTQAYSQAHRFRQAQSHGGKFPSKFQLETAARDIINKLANDSQNLVSSHLIEKALLKYFDVKDLRDLGIKFLDEINFVHELLKLQGRVSSYIQAYCSMATISSYYDLKECLQEFTPESGNFLDLNLGPLSRQPLVYKYFKIPPNYKLPKITGSQVWMHLKDFMTDRNLWTGQVDLTEFITYLQKQYNVPSPLHLGIRVQSLPLAIQMLKKAQKDQGRNLRTAFMQYKMELANDVAKAFQNFKADVLEKSDGDKSWEVKKYYCQASVPQVTGSIFNKLQILFNAVLYQNDGKWKELKKVSDIVAAFSSRLAEDRLLASLFQLAVSVSSHDFQENLVKKIFPSMGGGKESKNADDSEAPSEKMKVKPNPADLLSKLDKYVQRCLSHGQLTLEQMAKIEQKIVENYEVGHFGELGYGNFLAYIAETKDVTELLEELGVNLSGGVGAGAGSGSSYHPGLTDLLDLVEQCRLDPTVESERIEGALCSHYNVRSVKCLGYGPIKAVLIAHERQQKKRHGEQHPVLYESAVCANSSLVKSASLDAEGQVGRLGHQTRETALSCLQSCPLLENLADWSQWPLVFEPELGPLKQFVLKHGGCHTVQLQGVGTYQTDVVAMETEPGLLLKLTSHTSVDDYVTALEGGEVTAICGHLISIVVQSQGLRNAPISLLANHTLQYMMNLQNKELDKDKEGRVNAESHVVTFVRECLVALPLRLCHLLADKILLEPLSQVVGSTRSKVLLVESARSAAARSRLHALGILLGVSEWRDHYQRRVKEGHDAIVKKSREEKKLLEALVPKDIADDGGASSSSSESSDDEDDDDEASYKTDQVTLADDFLDSDEEEAVPTDDGEGFFLVKASSGLMN